MQHRSGYSFERGFARAIAILDGDLLVARDIRRVIDEVLDQTRGIRKGPLSLLDIVLMDHFERQKEISRIEDMVTFPVDLARDPRGTVSGIKKKARRKKSAYSKALKKTLRDANRSMRTKSGTLRKGRTSADVMKRAHKEAKKLLRRRK